MDWIVALFIFLIYLVYFFLYIRPLAPALDDSNSLTSIIEENIELDTQWSVEKLPIIINSNVSGKEPFMIDFGLNWTNFGMGNNISYDVDEGKLIFLADLKKGNNIVYAIKSNRNYSNPNTIQDLSSDQGSFSINSQEISADIDNGLISQLRYSDLTPITATTVSLDSVQLDEGSFTTYTNSTNFYSEYKIKTDVFNHSLYAFAESNRLFGLVKSNQIYEDHNLTITFNLANYTNFYLDEQNAGSFSLNQTNCTTYNKQYVDFQNSQEGISFVFPPGGALELCTQNNQLSLSASFDINPSAQYQIIPHQGDENSTLLYKSPFRYSYGVIEDEQGIDINLLEVVNQTDYETLKDQWGYPNQRDFSFEVQNDTGQTVLVFGPEEPAEQNVFAKVIDTHFLNQFAERIKIKIIVQTW